jgi:Flp pilus assembly protein TadB
VASRSTPQHRNAGLRAATWYAAQRSSRPPLWREVVHDVMRRAMADRWECFRLLVMLVVAAATSATVVVILALVVPPSVLAATGVLLGGLARLRRRSRRAAFPAREP